MGASPGVLLPPGSGGLRGQTGRISGVAGDNRGFETAQISHLENQGLSCHFQLDH